MSRKNILIVCSGNTCRSPLAESIISDFMSKTSSKEKYSISSGGIFAKSGTPASGNAIIVADELGLNLKKHLAKEVTQKLLDGSGLVLCVSQQHKSYLIHNFKNILGKCFTLSECSGVDSGDIADPMGGDVGQYKKTANDIKNLVPSIVDFIKFFFTRIPKRNEEIDGNNGHVNG